jgi:hypothetical protein
MLVLAWKVFDSLFCQHHVIAHTDKGAVLRERFTKLKTVVIGVFSVFE